jgi:hypothetical protein
LNLQNSRYVWHNTTLIVSTPELVK